MKISSDNNIHVLDTQNRAEQLKNTKQAGEGQKGREAVVDTVEFSTRKAEVEKLHEQTNALPATRQEKIAVIKQSIEDGTYNVKGELIARSMLKSQLLDELS
jgi:flagellar biosynthesis anti-sigma factor FlgM